MSQADKYTIRQFLPEEMKVYRSMRLEALQLEPGLFGNSYALEAGFTDDDWMDRVNNPTRATFGLYCGDELIGITAIVRDKDNPAEAYMTQSYIRKQHRGKGLSHMLYQARLEWARQRGLKQLSIGHRESNQASKAANQHYGFTFSHREAREWPDGSREDMLYYVLEL
jgi:GNAT superfamily N-acetyltransferase